MRKQHNNYKYLLLIAILLGMVGINKTNAQVYYGIDLQEDGKTYVVSLKSDVSLPTPLNMTSTAQITIKYPTSDSVQMENLTSLLPAVAWNKTVRIQQPLEATDYDYITFGLSSLGTTGITYEEDVELPLFSFENVGGVCAGLVEIIDNQNDAFLYPNSEKLSIKNQISVLGMGGSTYAGLYKGSIDCQTVSTDNIEIEIDENSKIELFPNPASSWLNVTYDVEVDANAYIIIYDETGRTIKTERLQNTQGEQTITMDVEDLIERTYFLQIKGKKGGETYRSKVTSFLKVN
ncbi:MAG: T9SS type A sorting domain-containing protein [Saprospiraceae bacterium]